MNVILFLQLWEIFGKRTFRNGSFDVFLTRLSHIKMLAFWWNCHINKRHATFGCNANGCANQRTLIVYKWKASPMGTGNLRLFSNCIVVWTNRVLFKSYRFVTLTSCPWWGRSELNSLHCEHNLGMVNYVQLELNELTTTAQK